MKTNSLLFKIAAAGAMAMTIAGCGSSTPPDPGPAVTNVSASQQANDFANAIGDMPNGVYKVEIDGKDFGVDGKVPCVAIRGYHRSGYGNSAVGGAMLGLSCNWDAAGKAAASAANEAVPAAVVSATAPVTAPAAP